MSALEYRALMTPAEAGAFFGVETATLSRWDRQRRFPEGSVIRTPGGTDRRYVTAAMVELRNRLAATP